MSIVGGESKLDITAIQKYIPHRYPFLFLDRVVEIVHGEYLLAVKNITFNEMHFQGHFPGNPLFPGVLVLECMAQACGLLTMVSEGVTPQEGKSYMLVGLDNVRFKRPVVPGDQLVLRAQILTHKRGIWKYQAEARVEDYLVASAEILCAEGEI
jgi:3-hydroxyacyl-[acyl-carrier-protein] dehydratase